MKLSKKLLIIIAALFLTMATVFAQNYTVLDSMDVNPFDRSVMNPYSKVLDYAGTAMEILSVATPSVLFFAPTQDYWKISIEYAETMLLAFGAKELCKLAVDRARPYMYFNGAPSNKIADGDWNDSFLSGHATLSFAAATFTTYMFCQYFPDSKWKIPVIVISYSFATATSVLRLTSGNHFLSDVLCGAALGAAIGFIVPWVNSFWFKPSISKNIEIAASPVGVYCKVKF